MTELDLNVIDLAYISMATFNELTKNDASKLDTFIFYKDINFLINYMALFASFIATSSAILSLYFTRKSYNESIQKNKEIIIKDRMIGAMNNVLDNMNINKNYRGIGTFMVYPIDDRKKSDVGIISQWNQVSTQPDIPNGNNNFVFTYRIFYGNQNKANHMLENGDWLTEDDSVSIHLIRTSDGHYTLVDRRILNSIDDFSPSSTTVFLDEQNYNCIIMMLDFIMMCTYSQLIECQDRAKNLNKGGR